MATVEINKQDLEQLQQQNSHYLTENQRIVAENQRLTLEASVAFNNGYHQATLKEKANTKVMEDIRLELRMAGCSSKIRSFDGAVVGGFDLAKCSLSPI